MPRHLRYMIMTHPVNGRLHWRGFVYDKDNNISATITAVDYNDVVYFCEERVKALANGD